MLTVGREGETIRLAEQTPTPLGQTLMLEHGGKTHRLALPLIGAYQAANVLTAAGLVLATGGEWADDLLGDAARRAGARPARTRGDQPRRGARSISIMRTRPTHSKRRLRRFGRMSKGG